MLLVFKCEVSGLVMRKSDGVRGSENFLPFMPHLFLKQTQLSSTYFY